MSGTSTYDTWADSPFVQWTNALGGHFFNPSQAGQPVWLTATPALLGEIGAPLGATCEDLVTVLVAGPPWDSARGELCRNARAAAASWRSRRRPPPPYPLYLGYLCLFAAAGATGDGAVRVNAYYPRLREFAKLPGTGTLKLFRDMAELWDDLERWSTADQQGALGLFRAAGVGQQRHIGLPLAQNLITPAERQALPAAYAAAGFQAGAEPAPEQLASALAAAAGARGLARLQGLLGAGTPPRDRELLLAVLADSLRVWRAQQAASRPVRPTPDAAARPARPQAGRLPQRGKVALAARLDRAAGRVELYLRVHLEPFPPVPVQLRAGQDLLLCEEQAGGWSTALSSDPSGGKAYPAQSLDWGAGAQLTAVKLGFGTALPAGGLRVLQPGSAHGLPHLLETGELDVGQPAVLLASEQAWPAVAPWGATGAGWLELAVDGLPAGWHLATVKQCPDPEPLQVLLPWRLQHARPRLLLQGGLRAGDGASHTYFDYARPAVRLSGGTGGEVIACCALELQPNAGGEHSLPSELQPGRHLLQARKGNAVVAEATIVLAVPAPAPQPGAAASAVVRPWAGRRDLLAVPALWQWHLGGERRGRDVSLLSRDGQCDRWLSTAPPPAGRPVWAVPPGWQPQAIYVGTGEPEGELPLLEQPSQAWVAILTGSDPRAGAVQPPREPALRQLWQDYQSKAHAYR